MKKLINPENKQFEVPVDFTTLNWMNEKDKPRLNLGFKPELTLRRVTDGCYTIGTVRGEHLPGDCAFRSNNPAGTDLSESSGFVSTPKEAQHAVTAIANMDIDLLGSLGLDRSQLAKAMARAGKIEISGEKFPSMADALQEEMQALAGHTFLTL